MDREALLHLRGALLGSAESYSGGDSKEESTEILSTRYGLTSKQAQERLGKLKKDPNQSIFDLSIEVTR